MPGAEGGAGAPRLYPQSNNGAVRRSYNRNNQTNNTSRFGPPLPTMDPQFHTTKSYTPYVRTFHPAKNFGRSIPKPNFKSGHSESSTSAMTKLQSATDTFKKNLIFSPTKIITNPQEIETSVIKSYASIISPGGKIGTRTAGGTDIDLNGILTTDSGFRRCVMPVESRSSATVALNSGNTVTDADSPDDAATEEDQHAMEIQNESSGESQNNTTHGLGNQFPAGSGFAANSFSDSYSQEAWIQYSGLIQDHLVKVESFIRAKAESLNSTLLVKMSNGGSPGGSPTSFQSSISGSISARSWKDRSTGRSYNLVPGKDFTVQPQVVPGIAELHVPLKEHREWLVGQYRFPYLKLSINAQGQVANHGQAGTFYITQLRAPLQLYDFWGIDAENFDKFDGPLENLITEICPSVAFSVVNIKTMVPSYNPVDNSWHSVPVLGNKRVTIEVPPGDDFALPDGPYLLNIDGVGERVVYSQRVKAGPECPYCGKRCFKDGCKERCQVCGLPFIEGHTEATCKHKDKGGKFASSNLWIEKTTRQALQYRTNLISYTDSAEQKVSILKQRLDGDSVSKAVLETQCRIMATAIVPLPLRNDFEARSANHSSDDILIPSEDSSAERRDRALFKQQRGSYTAQVRLTPHVPEDARTADEEDLERRLQEAADGAAQVSLTPHVPDVRTAEEDLERQLQETADAAAGVTEAERLKEEERVKVQEGAQKKQKEEAEKKQQEDLKKQKEDLKKQKEDLKKQKEDLKKQKEAVKKQDEEAVKKREEEAVKKREEEAVKKQQEEDLKKQEDSLKKQEEEDAALSDNKEQSSKEVKDTQLTSIDSAAKDESTAPKVSKKPRHKRKLRLSSDDCNTKVMQEPKKKTAFEETSKDLPDTDAELTEEDSVMDADDESTGKGGSDILRESVKLSQIENISDDVEFSEEKDLQLRALLDSENNGQG